MNHLRDEYESHTVRGFYEAVRDGSREYKNPHEPQVARALQRALDDWDLDASRVLDLAAGGGEITLALRRLRPDSRVEAADPYTHALYRRRTGLPCLPCSFHDIARGELAGRRYSLIVCSYALHLAGASELPALEIQLSFLAPHLLVLSPNHKPILKHNWRPAAALAVQRVKVSLYESEAEGPPPAPTGVETES